jgi:hypothetical protein
MAVAHDRRDEHLGLAAVVPPTEGKGPMGQMRVVEIGIDDGASVFIPVIDVVGEDYGEWDDATNVSALENLDVDALLAPVKAMGRAVCEQLATLKPSTARLEVGLAVAAKGGKLVSLFVDGSAEASMRITLEWTDPER